jgi:hypothetical protein
MAERRERLPLNTRIERSAFETIQRTAEERRTSIAQVSRILLEDAVRQLAGQAESAA